MRLALVVPCYNEEAVLPETVRRLGALLEGLVDASKIAATSGVWLIDDGSQDATWDLIRAQAAADPRFHGVKLSRNRGHQNALLAGLDAAEGDAVVTIDADLQDDLAVIEQMVDLHAAGIDIVYGVRRSRLADKGFKRITAEAYYRIVGAMGVQIVFNHADYRLMSHRAIAALANFTEVNLFLRGIVPQLGFATATVGYDRCERIAGDSKYPLRKMLALAVDGITSFSVTPLRVIASIGVAICVFSALMILWALYGKLTGGVISGWTSIILPTYFLGGVQLLSIGVIGEYIGKIYLETKRRPRFFVEQQV